MVVTRDEPAASRGDRLRTRVSGWPADVAHAWGYRPVRRGFVGSLLIALGSLSPAYLPQNTPLWEPMRAIGLDTWPGRVLATILVIAGVAFMVDAWFRLRPSVYHKIKHWPITLLWSLPLLPAPLIFSHDAYGYAALGWLLRSGLNPYETPIAALPGPFADQFSWVWRYNTAMYPPLSLEMFHGIVIAAGNNPYLSALAMRFPAVIGVGLIVYFLPRIARQIGADIQLTAWFSAINPLVIIDLVGGAHNDALMLGLVVLALWLACKSQFWWAAVVVGVAASIKQPAILAFYPVALIRHPWQTLKWGDTWPALRRLTLSLAVSVAAFVAITFATGLGFGWIYAMDVPGQIVTLAPFTLVGAGLKLVLTSLGAPVAGEIVMAVVRYLGLALTAAVIGWLALGVGRTRPVTFLSWSYLTFAFGGIALNSWYLTWGGVMLPLTKPNPRIIGTAVSVTAVLLAYEAGNLAWRNDNGSASFVAMGLAGMAVVIVLLYRHQQAHRAGAAGGTVGE